MSDRDDIRPTPADKPTVAQLVERLSEQITRLVRAEIALAKAELTGKLKRLGLGLGLFAVAGALAFFLLPLLLFMIAGFIAPHLGWGTALAIVLGGTVVLFILPLGLAGFILLKRSQPLTPEKAVENVTQDVATLKEGLRP